jgi:cell fate regulator YaaT (PSP1 superfamily)
LPRIVSIQFSTAGKLYDFDAGLLDISPRDKVIVETERGLSIGTVMTAPVEVASSEAHSGLVTIRRVATREDLDTLKQNEIKEKEAYEFCNRRIIERNMQMKLVRVEYLFDGSKSIFFFTADGRVDFRDLVKDLAHAFHTRIEMRQIGVRDESKMIGGIGICGRELCCCSFLRDFQPVSVKMAKEQNLALNPTKISGQCGRLLCCLDYEYSTYCSLRKTFPKSGKRVNTDSVSGIVEKLNILTGNITLRLDDGKIINVRRSEITGESPNTENSDKKPENQVADTQNTQKNQDKRGNRPERNPQGQRQESQPKQQLTTAKEPDSTQQKTEGQQKSGRKKNRSRKHGHRKNADGSKAADPNTTKPTDN